MTSLVALCPILWSFHKTQDRSPPCRPSEVQGQPPTPSARVPRALCKAYHCHLRGLRGTPGVLTYCPIKALKSGQTVLVSVWDTRVNNSNKTFRRDLRSAHCSGERDSEEAHAGMTQFVRRLREKATRAAWSGLARRTSLPGRRGS